MAYSLKKTQEKFIHRVDKLAATDAGFQDLILTLKNSNDTEVSQISRIEDKVFDDVWINNLEEGFLAIDHIIRNPSRFIKDVRNITPISQAKKITAESVRHLASHTQFVRSIDEKGNVIPEKILSLSTEDEYAIYENRFVMTLIKKVAIFLEKRYDYVKKYAETRNSDVLVIKSKVNIGGAIYEYESKIKMSVPSINKTSDKNNEDLMARIKSLHERVNFFLNSPFMEQMGEAKPITPPVLQTNMIAKNIYYKAAYRLWKFLDTYSKLGVRYSVKEVNAKFDEVYMNELYALTLASMLTLNTNKNEVIDFNSPKVRKKRFAPKVKMSIEDEFLLNERLTEDPIEIVVPYKTVKAQKGKSAEKKEPTQEELERIAQKKAKTIQEKEAKALRKEQARLKREEEKKRLRELNLERKRLAQEVEKQKRLNKEMQEKELARLRNLELKEKKEQERAFERERLLLEKMRASYEVKKPKAKKKK